MSVFSLLGTRTPSLLPSGGGTTQPTAPETPIASTPTPAGTGNTGVTGTGTASTPQTRSSDNYTFAGFDPSNPDYAQIGPGHYKGGVYQYLTQNNIDPTTQNWANQAASALNALYKTNAFSANDAETLKWEDEYVHSAPNGYGMTRGSYDPSKAGEFFWGSTTPGAAEQAAMAGQGQASNPYAQFLTQIAPFLSQMQGQFQQQSNPYAGLLQAIQGIAQMPGRSGPTISGAQSGTSGQSAQYQQLVDQAIRRAFGG